MEFEVFQEKGKGRRKCPALSGWITARTCGQHRLREISCLPSCKYLDQHERYQHARVAEGFHQRWAEKVRPLYEKGEPFALDFLIASEFSIYGFLRDNAAAKDGNLAEGLQFFQRQLGPIYVVETAGNALGKHLSQVATKFRQEDSRFDGEIAQSIVDILIELTATTTPQARDIINGFMGHLEANFDLSSIEAKSKEDEIITPPRIVTPH